MRLVTLELGSHDHLGIVDGDHILIPEPDGSISISMLALIETGPAALAALSQQLPALRKNARRLLLADARLKAPIPQPRKNILCLGLNYADHARESAVAKGLPVKLPENPVVFTKAVTTVIGPQDDVPAHAAVTQQLDWEVELGVIIGTGGRGIPRSQALQHVFGYTVINDLSARDLQFRHQQFFLGKSLDGHCPMGPVIVTADEIPNPQELALQCRVNGTLKQEGNTRDMIFDIATTIEILSRGMTLEPGDVISTGTPAGVGFARQPPEFLKPGDIVECSVAPIGTLRNRIVN